MALAVSMRLMDQGEVVGNAEQAVLADGGEVEVTVMDGDEVQHRFTMDPVLASRLGASLRWIGRRGMRQRLRMEFGYWRNVGADKAADAAKWARGRLGR